MNEHNENILHTVMETIIFMLAISVLIALVYSFTHIEEVGKKNIDNKTNVSMAIGNDITTSLELSKSDTAYQICQLCEDSAVTIVIEGRTLTQVEKDAIVQNNSEINAYLTASAKTYTKSTIVNHDGTLNRVEYIRN